MKNSSSVRRGSRRLSPAGIPLVACRPAGAMAGGVSAPGDAECRAFDRYVEGAHPEPTVEGGIEGVAGRLPWSHSVGPLSTCVRVGKLDGSPSRREPGQPASPVRKRHHQRGLVVTGRDCCACFCALVAPSFRQVASRQKDGVLALAQHPRWHTGQVFIRFACRASVVASLRAQPR